MGALYGQRVTVGQARGPDVELVVYGDEFYARYETPDGFPVVYDAQQGQFSYARLDEGRFVSTGVPVTAPPPSGIERHAQEDPRCARKRRAAARCARAPHRTKPGTKPGTLRLTPPLPPRGAPHRGPLLPRAGQEGNPDQGPGRRAGRRAGRIGGADANFLRGRGVP